MNKHLRLALTPLLFLACAPSQEERGCQPGEPAACTASDSGALTGAIALDAVAHVRGPTSANPSGRDQEATLDTDHPDVIRLLDERVSVAPCAAPATRVKALRAGTAVVRFTFPDGQVVSASVDVVPAANARLVPFLDELAAGKKVKGDPLPLESDTKEIVQLAGGKAVWRVAYTSATGSSLRGSGATTYTLPEGATSTPVASDRDRELFELDTPKALAPGAKLEARAANITLSVPVRVVPADAVTSVRVYVQDVPSSGADGGAGDAGAPPKQLAVLARATDATGATVRGAPFAYTLGGMPVDEGGDILLYDFDPKAPERPLTATVPGSTAKGEASISAAPTPNLTRSTARDYANCSYAPGGAGAGATAGGVVVALGVALLGLVGRRRRRPAPESAPTAK